MAPAAPPNGAVRPAPPPPTPTDRRVLELEARARRRDTEPRRVTMISRKGGIGKTTTTLLLGQTLASRCGERVAALDANPDGGSLADRVTRETEATVADVLRASEALRTYADLRAFTSQDVSGLEIVAGCKDAQTLADVGEDAYARALDLLSRYYSLILCDTGTRITEPAAAHVLRLTDQLVVCASPALDSARVAARTLDWLEASGYRDLMKNAVVVLTGVREDTPIDVDLLDDYFRKRCRTVVRIPWDDQLALGVETAVANPRPETVAAYLELAGEVLDGLETDQRSPAGEALVTVSWRGEAAYARRTEQGHLSALEVPGLVSGGASADGRPAFLHFAGQGEVLVRLVRLPPPAPGSREVQVVLEAEGLVREGRGPSASPVYLLTGQAGAQPARVLVDDAGGVFGVEVRSDLAYRPVSGDAERVSIPNWVWAGRDRGGRPVTLEETTLRLTPATVLADPSGVPLALDVHGHPEAATFTL